MSGTDPPLLSHSAPTLLLKEHVAQVEAAAAHLFDGHSPRARSTRPETAEVLCTMVRGHDLGKGSPAFQAYIRDPVSYRGDPRAKEHSALSAALAVLWARRAAWPALRVLALAQAIAGHHAGFAPLEHLRERLRPDDDDLLVEQWAGLDLARLAAATGLDVAGIAEDFAAAGRWLFRRVRADECLEALSLAEAVRFRLWTQFLFSLLLEADKAFLALHEEDLRLYLREERPVLDAALVDRHLVTLPSTPLDGLRSAVRARVLARFPEDVPCATLTLPTGVGKTLLAASWALEARARMARSGSPPRIIVVLPYLSIIDQTEQEYRRLFGLTPEGAAQTEWVMASHSLSARHYELEGQGLSDTYADFFIDTWRSEVVLTTFDQLLLALFSPKTRHLMRCHALLDALVILDEVQTLPTRLWHLVDHALRALTEEGSSRVLMMSATQPALLSGARELAGDPAEVAEVFACFRRYAIRLRHRADLDLAGFIDELRERLPGWRAAGRRVLVTVNTRACARAVWDALFAEVEGDSAWTVHLISADVTPRDRLRKIDAVKSGRPCVVVSTQTVEAGVDIDMEVTIRDFAPLDALVQVAGRCNRNNRLGDHGGAVEVVALRDGRGRSYAGMVYDPILLDVTREVLSSRDALGEEDVLDLSRRYFDLLKARRNTGADLTEAFARWRELPDVHALLRGAGREQIAFLVLYGNEGERLRGDLRSALAEPDPWARRRALRRLAPALAGRTVSVYARRDLHPETYADPLGPFWDLHTGYYSPERGLDLRLDDDEPVCIF